MPRNLDDVAWDTMWAKIGQASSLSELANIASEADYFYFATRRGVLKVHALDHAIERLGFKCYLGSRNQFRDKCIQKLIDEHATVPPRKNPSPEPANKALYNRVAREAKKKFDVWPSIYASSWVVREYKKRGGRYVNPLTGLDKWYAEQWVDLGRSIDSKGHVKKWVQCGRPDASKGKYPKCVPLAKAKKMTPKQRLDAVKRKRAAEKTASKTKGRKPVMVKTLKKNPPSWSRKKSGAYTADGPLRTKRLGYRLELEVKKKSGQWHLTSKIFDDSNKCIYTYTSGTYKTLKDAKSRGDHLMASEWSHSKKRDRGWGLVEKNPYREPASGGMKQGFFGMQQSPDARWELVGENARGTHVFGTLTQYGDSVMYSLRHFDAIPRGFSAADYRSPRLADDKRHGVLDIHGLRGDEVFQEAFRQLATTQDLILNDYRRVNPSDPYREKERFKHEGMEAKEAFKHEGKKAELKKRTTLRERVSKMIPNRKTKKNPEDNDAVLIKEIFESLSKEDVKLLGGKKKVIGEIVWIMGEARGRNTKEEYVFDYVTEMLDYDVQELKAKKSTSKRKAKKNPSDFLPVVMHAGKGYIGNKQALYSVAGSGDKSLYDVNVFARRDGGRVVQRLQESWSTPGEDPEEAAKLAFARMVQDTGISVETRTRTEGMIPQKNPKKKRAKKTRRGARKNPPINLDYLDQMMGKEDADKASEGIKKGSDALKRQREEKKRIKEFLKKGKRDSEISQDWTFTYSPAEDEFVPEMYSIETPSYWRREDFDSFDEASERLKSLDRAIELGSTEAPMVLLAAAGDRGHGIGSEYTNRDAADALEGNVYDSAFEEFGNEGDLSDVATEAYRRELHKELASNAGDYLPNGFSIRSESLGRGAYRHDLYAPDGTHIGGFECPIDVVERAQEAVGREENPKRKAVRAGAKKKNSRKTRKTRPPGWRKQVESCRKHWEAYCAKPTKTNLKKVFKHLDAMAESSAKSVKDEARKCLRVAKLEAKDIGLKP